MHSSSALIPWDPAGAPSGRADPPAGTDKDAYGGSPVGAHIHTLDESITTPHLRPEQKVSVRPKACFPERKPRKCRMGRDASSGRPSSAGPISKHRHKLLTHIQRSICQGQSPAGYRLVHATVIQKRNCWVIKNGWVSLCPVVLSQMGIWSHSLMIPSIKKFLSSIRTTPPSSSHSNIKPGET